MKLKIKNLNDSQSEKYEQAQYNQRISYLKVSQILLGVYSLCTLSEKYHYYENWQLVLFLYYQIFRFFAYLILRRRQKYLFLYVLQDSCLMGYTNVIYFINYYHFDTQVDDESDGPRVKIQLVIIGVMSMTAIFLYNVNILNFSWLQKFALIACMLIVIQLTSLRALQKETVLMGGSILLFLLFFTAINYCYDYHKIENFLAEEEKEEELIELQKQKIQNLDKLGKFKDLILASVSHDLKTPIISISTQIQNALCVEDLASIKDYLRTALKSVDMLDYQVKDIMDFSYFHRHGTVRIKPQRFALREIITQMKSIFEQQIELKNLQFEIVCKTDSLMDLEMFTDKVRINQILINLLSNAVKFTSQGKIRLKIKFLRQPQTSLSPGLGSAALQIPEGLQHAHSDKIIKFSVTDTGLGIEKDKLDQLFKFFSTFDTQDGNGLGLAISNSLVRQLGPSKIELKSKYRQGSKFSFQIYQDLREYYKQNHNPDQVILIDELLVSKDLNNRKSPLESNQNSQVACPEVKHPLRSQAFKKPHAKKCDRVITQQFQKRSQIRSDDLNSRSALEISEEIDESIQKVFECSLMRDSLWPKANVFSSSPQQSILLSLAASKQVDTPVQNKVRVLLVDDEPFNHLALKNMVKINLSKYMEITSAFNGEDGYLKAKEQLYDMIILDQQMPVLLGTEVVRKIKKDMTEGNFPSLDTKVFISSANDSVADQKNYHESGVDGIIVKPIRLSVMKDILRKFFQIQVVLDIPPEIK